MTPEEIRQTRQDLQEEIAALEAQITEFKAHAGPVEPDKALGRLSRLDEMSAKSVHQAALKNAEDKLRRVKYKLMTLGTPLYEG